MSSPSTSHRIPIFQVVTEHWVEVPASHSKFPLAIYFTHGNYMFQCFSLSSSHPLLLLLVSTSLLSIDVDLFV